MKEFEKWLKEGSWKDCVYSVEDSDLLNELQEDVAKKAWKAALKWVLENFDGKTDILELGFRIREEMDYE